MRTTFDVPTELIAAAQKLLGFKSKREVVVYSLQELIRRSEVSKIKELSGKFDFNLDLNKSRRRRGSS